MFRIAFWSHFNDRKDIYNLMISRVINNKKAQLTQREARDSLGI